jgi:hypothetical protein
MAHVSSGRVAGAQALRRIAASLWFLLGLLGLTSGARSQTIPVPTPTQVNLFSGTGYYPSIMDQEKLNASVAIASTYYALSYELKRSLSPRWTFALTNDGLNAEQPESDLIAAGNILTEHGAPSSSSFNYNGKDAIAANYCDWGSTSVWQNALTNRPAACKYLAPAVTSWKNTLAAGHPIVALAHLGSWQFQKIEDVQTTTLDDDYEGRDIATWSKGADGLQALTVVGYDDTIWVDINANDQIDLGERGAFRVANSRGRLWKPKDTYDNGYTWVAYDALTYRSGVIGGPSDGRYEAFDNTALYFTAPTTPRTPQMVAYFTLKTLNRNQLNVRLGWTSLTGSGQSINPAALQRNGGDFSFAGSNALPSTLRFAVDLSSIMPPDQLIPRDCTFFLEVTDNDPEPFDAPYPGITLSEFSLVHAERSPTALVATDNLPPQVADGSSVTSFITYAVLNGQLIPDLLVKRIDDVAYLGNNLYTPIGTGQTIAQQIRPGVPRSYEFAVENDGVIRDSLTVRASGMLPGWTVALTEVGPTGIETDVTAEFTSATGWQLDPMLPGARRTFRVIVAANPAVAAGEVQFLKLSARWNVWHDEDVALIRSVAPGGRTVRLSVPATLEEGNGESLTPSMSADGQFIAFASKATNLLPLPDTNRALDIYVVNQFTGMRERVSVTSAGGEADLASDSPAISGDGRFVVFRSAATNLDSSQVATNPRLDLYLHDRQLRTTVRITRGLNGAQADQDSATPVISPDGRLIVFVSYASNLVAGDTNLTRDVFLYERLTGHLERVSLTNTGGQANGPCDMPAMSDDGNLIVFRSSANNLIPGDRNSLPDIYVRNRQAGTTWRVSVSTTGTESNGASGGLTDLAISGNGRLVAFVSNASNLVTPPTAGEAFVFLHDLTTRVTTQVAMPTSLSTNGIGALVPRGMALNGDARYLALVAQTSALASGSAMVYLLDLQDAAQTLEPISISTSTSTSTSTTVPAPNGHCGLAAHGVTMSTDCRFIAFESLATNLVFDDFNGLRDIYCVDRGFGSGSYRPDAEIGSGETFIGNDLYGLANEQTLPQIVQANTRLDFQVRVGNDAPFIDAFRVTATAGTEHWTMTVTDAATLQDLTAEVTGSGYQLTPQLPGSTRLLNIGVRPASSVLGGTEFPFALTLTSVFDATRTDTVASVIRRATFHWAQLTAAPGGPVFAGTPIVLTARTNTGGTPAFRFLAGVQSGTAITWQELRAFGAASTCTWIPPSSGEYRLRLEVRRLDDTGSAETFVEIPYNVAAPLSAVAVRVNLASPQPTGNTLTLTAIPTGGLHVEYKFLVGFRSGTAWSWTVLRGYSSLPTQTWRPTTARPYTVLVWARNVGSTANYDFFGTQAYTILPALSGVTLTATPAPACLANQVIKLTALATGGGQIQYRFRVWEGDTADGTPINERAYGAGATWQWTPTQLGTYLLQVTARDTGTLQVVSRGIVQRVTTPIVRVALAVTPGLSLMRYAPATLTATPDGGRQVEYKFELGTPSGTSWRWETLQAYSLAASCQWIPQLSAPRLMLKVQAREVVNRAVMVYKTVYVAVNEPVSLTAFSISPREPSRIGQPLTFTAASTGGVGVEYRFRHGAFVNGRFEWITLRDFAAQPTYLWTPTRADLYLFEVTVRDQLGGEESMSLSYEVNAP